MKIMGWIAPGTWPVVVEALQQRSPDDQLKLIVIADEAEDGAARPRHGLLGRGRTPHETTPLDHIVQQAAADLLAQSAAMLGRPCEAEVRHGRTEREVVAAAETTDLLIVARDGDLSRLGPHSLGRHTRFVIDHAPCSVLLLWPGQAPDTTSIPALPGRI